MHGGFGDVPTVRDDKRLDEGGRRCVAESPGLGEGVGVLGLGRGVAVEVADFVAALEERGGLLGEVSRFPVDRTGVAPKDAEHGLLVPERFVPGGGELGPEGVDVRAEKAERDRGASVGEALVVVVVSRGGRVRVELEDPVGRRDGSAVRQVAEDGVGGAEVPQDGEGGWEGEA